MRSIVLALMTGAGLADAANAAEILVTADITTSTTWVSTNTYNLQNQIYVTNGATLTIEAGTVIASTPSVNGAGALAVTRGSKLNVMGTASDPVIMTSTNDDFVTWRAAANEWGNLTIMGSAFISENDLPNSPTCSASNEADMEGLTNGPSTDRYGGGDDDDDSGTISYLSLRYGGRVVGLANELNGLSLGGVGRGTDMHHIEIMNNVDDGIEIWGGTLNLKYFSIWNVGDDSFDLDQGWRGKAQFGLIVQGYSLDANQGSGVGDNCFETDGAEDSDYQPVLTASIYNCTVIGNPLDGDHLTAWRDGARVQYRNCVFMDIGANIVQFDNTDDPNTNGYGHNGTLTWDQVWTTDHDFNFTTPQHVNDCPNPATVYAAQVDGKLAEISDSVFFRPGNLADGRFSEFVARGQDAAGNNNVFISSFDNCDAPIRGITRGELFTSTGQAKRVRRVVSLDPRAANEATTSVGTAPNDGFFDQANYRGAFSPTDNWLEGWSAADAYGFLDPVGSSSFCDGNDLSLLSCPCGNVGSDQTGCDSPIPPMAGGGLTGGVKLTVTGQSFGAMNLATAITEGYPVTTTPTAIIIRSVAPQAATTFGDGILCLAGSVVRTGTAVGTAGTATHIFGHGTMAGTGCFYYQAWFRSTPVSFCDATAGFNLSNGRTMTW